MAGQTTSSPFPGTAGGAQPAIGGGFDGFVARLPSTLTSLIQATYLGGTGNDSANALAIHPTTGDVYVAGVSPSASSVAAFVARLSSTLTTLTQAIYLGGDFFSEALALAIHPTSGDVYVAGNTDSFSFPGTAGGAQPDSGGGFDAFVARLPNTLTSLTQATYLGGSGGDSARALAIHPTSGDVYVAGNTDSFSFPGTAGGAQPDSGGGFNAFVARLPNTLTSLTQATYLGGTGNNSASALAIHPTTRDVYVAGFTGSSDFPGTAGGAQSDSGGGFDAFVARLPSTLSSLTQATYLGGTGGDSPLALAIHPTTGDVYVAGVTDSISFPGTAGGAQPAIGGGFDAFVARLTSSLALVDAPLSVPTLSEWALFAMVALLLMTGLLALRRHRWAH